LAELEAGALLGLSGRECSALRSYSGWGRNKKSKARVQGKKKKICTL